MAKRKTILSGKEDKDLEDKITRNSPEYEDYINAKALRGEDTELATPKQFRDMQGKVPWKVQRGKSRSLLGNYFRGTTSNIKP